MTSIWVIKTSLGRSWSLKFKHPLSWCAISMDDTERLSFPYHPWDWYIYLHLVDVYSKCREIYQPHGWYGFEGFFVVAFLFEI